MIVARAVLHAPNSVKAARARFPQLSDIDLCQLQSHSTLDSSLYSELLVEDVLSLDSGSQFRGGSRYYGRSMHAAAATYT